MAFTFSNVTSQGGLNVTSVVTLSTFTSVTANYYILPIYNRSTTTTPAPTSTNGITFSLITSIALNTGKIWLYAGYCTSGASGAVSYTVTANDSNSCSLDTVTGMVASGAAGVSNAANVASATTLSGIAFTSATYMFFGQGAVGATMGAEAGFTQLSLQTGSSYGQAAYNTGPDSTPTFSVTSGSFSPPYGIVAFELKGPDVAFGTAPVVNSLMLMGMGI